MTMTMPAEALLDWLDFSVTCCATSCDQAADWWLVCKSCNAHLPYCEPHRRKDVLNLTVGDPFRRVVCARCLENVRTRQWSHLFEFVPIGAA